MRLLLVFAIAMTAVGPKTYAKGTSPSASGELRVAYVSSQRVFAQSLDGRAAEEILSGLIAEKETAIAARNAKLQNLHERLEEGRGLVARSVTVHREQELARFQLDVRAYVESVQAEFLATERRLEGGFVMKLRPAVEQVAKEKGILLVIDADSVPPVWAVGATDITADVVANINR